MSTYTPIKELSVHGPRVRLLFAQRRNVGHWRFQDLRAPYWRLYSMEKEGAWVETEQGRQALEADQVYLIPSDTPFGTGSEEENGQLFIHFVLEPQLVQSSNLPSLTGVKLDPVLRALRDRVLQEEVPALQSMWMQSLVEATLAVSGLPLHEREVSTRMDKAQHILRQHLRSGIRNAELAKELQLSENGFVRWFTNEEGVSPQAWLNRERVHEASFWLHHTDAPLDHIAELHGFCDRYHFSRVFKKIQGISPAAFRKNREPETAPLTVTS